MKQKEKLWELLRKNAKALKEPKNVILLGDLGVGKSSFINTAIATLTGKHDYYAFTGSGSKHITTTFHRISRADYWNPEDEEDKLLCFPTFFDIMGLDSQLSTEDEEDTVNSMIMNLIISGKLPENCDLLDASRNLKAGKQITDTQEEKSLTVDMIIVVISAETPTIPKALIDEIYYEANIKKKKIPVFCVLTKVDKCDLSEQELEDKKIEICEAISITPDRMLLCTNYQPGQTPDVETDLRILEFMATLCNPRFKTVTLQKAQFTDPAPPPPPPQPTPAKETAFWKKVLQWSFVFIVIAFFVNLILQILFKDKTVYTRSK
ncbi:uncharacterized protein LOC125658165 isoform X2 [Ostrea edulis]|nr:uncharacterized protein LOC125658165 isoform X2 [Ostrea edulis]